jgi:hypothetical protein
MIRLLKEVGKRGRGKGERFGILPFPNKDASQYLSVKGERERGKGKEKTFNPYPVGELVEPLTFSPNQIPV